MSRNYYSEINLHLNWHTKDSAPLLTPDVETLAHRCLRERLIGTEGVFVHEIGGTDTHVHVCVTVPPTILISEFVGQLKGASSYEVNRRLGLRSKVLQWQTGYGVVSFGTRDIPWVKQYIQNQREHHSRGTARERLERTVEVERSPGDPA
jgi:putative transposase